ncbi:MAG TPA: tail fiber protein [Verrucomicrobiae bacterium]|jgi:microcystin-dependent protein|nr:tail fiber protein [Verrucomicrobiae bacterium]
MSEPYLGEIRIVGFNFAPLNWAFCDGQLMPIAENEALFTLLGTTYGGDGQQTFALPDLRSRAPLHMGSSGLSNRIIGEASGSETVTLTTQQMPNHTHPANANGAVSDSAVPNGKFWAANAGVPGYAVLPSGQPPQMSGAAITAAGGSQPHDNMPPFVTVNFIIALFGIYPSQN